MRSEYTELAWIGEQAVVFGYDSEGEFRKRELTGNEMTELLDLQEKNAAAEQRLLDKLLFDTEAAR